MIFAFRRVQTLQDVVDVIALLKRGATVGVEPVEGGLFGPTKPCAFRIYKHRSRHGKVGPKDDGSKCLRMIPDDLESFLVDYMSERRIFADLDVYPCDDDESIGRVWRHLNFSAGTWLTRTAIKDLLTILADHYGGTIEAQIPYGSDGWVEWIKGGHGAITLWHQPSRSEVEDLIEYGAKSIINAVAASSSRKWFIGMAGPYLMPDYGFLDHDPERTPEEAVIVSSEPTGIGPTWDATRAYYRLSGLQAAPDATDDEIKALAKRYVTGSQETALTCQDRPVRPVWTLPRKGATEDVWTYWGKWVRVVFEDEVEVELKKLASGRRRSSRGRHQERSGQ
ncbi:hypothetical protein [Methylobacterium sp. Leaf466]|uniref:hypothetical protein n=1 Tax=Methylobacterium sp. Leaf466 TaxID=1736386 RepID=UPI0006F8D97A|nr:hypothetical protein [Methylobacterium sp. Leaf466]KQT82437.1 hypothetical protein ASG59_18770 [Methylobacterium sp. Leaf466]